jgi:prepilin-type N-terminal cleavage/methylation domain-containing protein
VECQNLLGDSVADAGGRDHATVTSRASHAGFTLIELLITITIILTICALAIPNLLAAVNQARIAKAIGDLRSIGDDVEAYNVIHYQYPDSLADIALRLHRREHDWGRFASGLDSLQAGAGRKGSIDDEPAFFRLRETTI